MTKDNTDQANSNGNGTTAQGNGAKNAGTGGIVVERDANGSVIIQGNGNTVTIDKLICKDYPEQQLLEIISLLKEWMNRLPEGASRKLEAQTEQRREDARSLREPDTQQSPRASVYLWEKLASEERHLKTILRVAVVGGAVRLIEPDVNFRIAQAEIASPLGQAASSTSQPVSELVEHVGKLVREDLSGFSRSPRRGSGESVNKLSLDLSLPDIETERLIRLEIDYFITYRLKIDVKTLTGEKIDVPATITMFQMPDRPSAAPLEVCQYTTRQGENAQIPEIEPGRYLLQVVSRNAPKLLWKIDLELNLAGRI